MREDTNQRTRPKRLSDVDIAKIMGILDGWRGPLTWNLLLDEVKKITGHQYTRQGLYHHEAIRTAYVHRKANIDSPEIRPAKGSVALKFANDRIQRLENTVARLEKQNQDLLAQFARYCYNAAGEGWDPEILNRSLRKIDREPTRKKP